MKKLLLVDGHNLLFRMFYGIPNSVKNKKGEEVKGVMGFINNLIKTYRMLGIDDVIVVFDSEESVSSNVTLLNSYKKNRTIDYNLLPDCENPFSQLDKIKKCLDYLEVTHIEYKEGEADDYIASLAMCYQENYDVIVLSTDRDFLQIVTDKIRVFSPRGKYSKMFDAEMVYEDFGVYPNQIVEYKALVGDKSDNIMGITGIGPKKAKFVLSYGSIDYFIREEFLDKSSNKIKNILIEHQDTLMLYKQVIAFDLLEIMNFNMKKTIIGTKDRWYFWNIFRVVEGD